MMMILWGLVSAFLVGQIIEYFIHKGLHGILRDTRWGRIHERHHQDYFLGIKKGFLSDLEDYVPIGILLSPLGLMGGLSFETGWLIGDVSYVLLVALSHTLSHAVMIGWHHRHHEGDPSKNLGVLSPLMDVVLRTR